MDWPTVKQFNLRLTDAEIQLFEEFKLRIADYPLNLGGCSRSDVVMAAIAIANLHLDRVDRQRKAVAR